MRTGEGGTDTNFHATKLYTEALDSLASLGKGQSIEDRRILLANRALAYMGRKDIYSALPDCELTLTPEHTSLTSPKAITAKHHFCRAKIWLIMTTYEEALKDYRLIKRLQQEIVDRVADTDREVLDKITKALHNPVSEKAELICVVQVGSGAANISSMLGYNVAHSGQGYPTQRSLEAEPSAGSQ